MANAKNTRTDEGRPYARKVPVFEAREEDPFGGELALDQLWLQRPALALSRYATPIPGLYLGGAANHPGGPFLGGAGVLAARRALG